MKSYSMIAAAVLMAGTWVGLNRACVAQAANAQNDANHAAPGAQSQNGVPAGNPADQAAFYILAEFTQSLNAKKLKPGDPIKAQVTQDVLSHGKIIIPVESRLVGHVTEVKLHDADGPESRLGIIFDKVLLKHRAEVDFRGVLHALQAPVDRTSRVDQPDQMLPPNFTGMNRSSGPSPVGSSTTTPGRGSSSSNSQSISSNPAGNVPLSSTVPLTNVPYQTSDSHNGITAKSSHPQVSSGEQQSMSVGMPLGVFGLKGLTLSRGASAQTPGPVILSVADNVKLESGTQVLLKVFNATVSQP